MRLQCGQRCFLCLIKKFRKISENYGLFATVLIYLFEAFDSISNIFLIVKLNNYAIDILICFF